MKNCVGQGLGLKSGSRPTTLHPQSNPNFSDLNFSTPTVIKPPTRPPPFSYPDSISHVSHQIVLALSCSRVKFVCIELSCYVIFGQSRPLREQIKFKRTLFKHLHLLLQKVDSLEEFLGGKIKFSTLFCIRIGGRILKFFD